MPLFGPPNVEKLKAKGNLQGLIKALTYQKDQSVRYNAAKALGEIRGANTVEPLIAALRDSSEDVREAATRALGEIGDARAVEPLIAAFKDAGFPAREAAAKALGQLGDARAVDPLITALKESDLHVCRAASVALGQLGDARAIEPLTAALGNPSVNVGSTVAEALDKLGWQPDKSKVGAVYWIVKAQWDKCIEIGAPAVEPLIASLKNASADGHKVAEALDGLGWQPDKSEVGAAYWIVKAQWDKCIEIGAPAVEPLIASLKNASADERKAAIGVLVKIGTPAVEPLIVALKDASADVREAAAKALGEIGDARAEKPLFDAIKLSEQMSAAPAGGPLADLFMVIGRDIQIGEQKVRVAAMVALGKMGAPVVEPLIAALNDPDKHKRQAAAEALGEIGDVRAVQPLIAALKASPLAEIAAASALAKMGAPAVEPLLVALRNSADEIDKLDKAQAKIGPLDAEARLIAVRTVEEHGLLRRMALVLGKIGAPAVESLLTALRDSKKEVRRAAASALGETGDARAVELLIVALRDNTDKYMRSEAAEALGKIGDERAVEPLIAVLKDSDGSVRRSAVEALGKIGDPRAVEPLLAVFRNSEGDEHKAAAEALKKLGQEV
ncbi:MAG: HEAT repeat domain-containing protein [Chloroflexi bacterium]|nr:HEAT repeat domain-containing protein [Chloroflexota bacterium]